MAQDSKITIPEPPPEIGAGFLSEIWRGDSPLPLLRGPALVAYYARRGVETVLSLPMSSLITVMTIAVSLFLFAGFLLLLQNAERIITDAGGTLAVTAYVKEGVGEPELNDFIREVEHSNWARTVDYTSKDEALATFREELGARGSFLDGLDQSNPLPASLDIILQPDELGIGRLDAVINQLRAHPLVDEVIYGSEWVEQTQKVLRSFRIISLVLLFVVLVVIVFLISNTIKLVIYARQDELSIMQLVGATGAFVKVPFIIGGMIQGFIGAVAGLVLLKLGFALLTYEFQYSTLLGVALPKIMFLGPFAITMIILLGLAIGAVGSFFALGRFMNV